MKKNKESCSNNCDNRGKCIFQDVDPATWETIDRYAVQNFYKKNQAVYLQGSPSQGLYCVHSGKIKLLMVNNEGKESIIRIADSGDILGQRSLFENKVNYASAVAIEDAEVCFFPKNLILEILLVQPSVALQLLVQLSRYAGNSDAQNATLVHKNVRERLAGLLLQFNDSYGVNVGETSRLDIKLTREEMAAMIGTTHETLVRLMTEFKNEGIITQEGKIIFIINHKKLVEFANA